MTDKFNKFNKLDEGKTRWHLLPMGAVTKIVDVLEFGTKKHGLDNWKHGTKYSVYHDAALRHLFAWWEKEDDDKESGLSHLAHAACCVLFLLYYQITGTGTDDRAK